MIPVEKITGSTLDSLFVYMAILGILLLFASFLRLKIKFLKKYYIPASLIAGVIGLLLGPHFLGFIPSEITGTWSAMSGRLIVLVFAPMLMVKSASSAKSIARSASARVLFSYTICFLQYALPLLLGVLILTPVFHVPDLFGTIVEQGWAGGHGTAGGMAVVFEEFEWLDGQSLSVTSATIGLVFGIIGGVLLINVAARRGWTATLQHGTGLKNDDVEIYKAEDGKSSSKSVISANVIDTFAFHAAVLSLAIFLGWILRWVLKTYLHFSVAWFVTSLFAGLFLRLILDRTPYAGCLDKNTLNRIQGIALEFLVAGAVASVNVPVVVSYAAPLVIQQVAMMVVMTAGMIFFAKHIFPQYWFENFIQAFGTYSGVAATGLLLLRTCDPEMKSDGLEVLAAATPFCSWAIGGGILTSITPGLVVQYGAMKIGLVYLAGMIICIVMMRLFTWNKKSAS